MPIIAGWSMDHPSDNLEADVPPIGRDGLAHKVTWQGQFLKWQVFGGTRLRPKPRKREEIYEFSRASRFRMLCKIATTDWKAAGKCQFLTLTYPDHFFGIDHFQLSAHRTEYWRRLEQREKRKVCGLWRTEWEKRLTGKHVGKYMPHLHIIAFDVPEITNRDANNDWCGALSYPDYVNTVVKKMESAKQVACYVAKYAAKPDCILGNVSYLRECPPGRRWGILRRKSFPADKIHVTTLPNSAMTDACREFALIGRPQVNDYGNESFTLLGANAGKIGAAIFGTWVDGEIPNLDN